MKNMIIYAITIFTIGFANAQSRESGTFELTPVVGYSSYTLGGDNASGLKSVTGVFYGVFGDYFFNNRWSIRSGLTNTTMGARDNYPNELKLNYIVVPINANWHFGSTRKWNLNFGVSPSFLTSAKFNDNEYKSNINSFQLGISYGIGYKIEVTEDFSILIDTQGLVGTSNIYKEGNVKQFNSGSSINIGGVFHF